MLMSMGRLSGCVPAGVKARTEDSPECPSDESGHIHPAIDVLQRANRLQSQVPSSNSLGQIDPEEAQVLPGIAGEQLLGQKQLSILVLLHPLLPGLLAQRFFSLQKFQRSSAPHSC